MAFDTCVQEDTCEHLANANMDQHTMDRITSSTAACTRWQHLLRVYVNKLLFVNQINDYDRIELRNRNDKMNYIIKFETPFYFVKLGHFIAILCLDLELRAKFVWITSYLKNQYYILIWNYC